MEVSQHPEHPTSLISGQSNRSGLILPAVVPLSLLPLCRCMDSSEGRSKVVRPPFLCGCGRRTPAAPGVSGGRVINPLQTAPGLSSIISPLKLVPPAFLGVRTVLIKLRIMHHQQKTGTLGASHRETPLPKGRLRDFAQLRMTMRARIRLTEHDMGFSFRVPDHMTFPGRFRGPVQRRNLLLCCTTTVLPLPRATGIQCLIQC